MLRPDPFPRTRWSVIRDAIGSDPARREEAWRKLIAAYRVPIEGVVRRHVWRKAACEEIVSDFWTFLCTKEVLQKVDPARGFRKYIQVVARRYANHALKVRGQSLEHDVTSLDSPLALEEAEEAAWAEGILQLAIERLVSRRPRDGMILLRRHGIAPGGACDPTPPERLAEEYELSPEALRQALCRARKALREEIRESLRESVADEAEFESEEGQLVARLLEAHPGFVDPASDQ